MTATHAAGWWYRPEFIINELNINAAITQPVHEETVPLTPKAYTVRGYAYTGDTAAAGGSPVAAPAFPGAAPAMPLWARSDACDPPVQNRRRAQGDPLRAEPGRRRQLAPGRHRAPREADALQQVLVLGVLEHRRARCCPAERPPCACNTTLPVSRSHARHAFRCRLADWEHMHGAAAVDLLRSTEIRVRAVDSSNNMMPEKLTWNLMGALPALG